jgi:hypothetical protein
MLNFPEKNPLKSSIRALWYVEEDAWRAASPWNCYTANEF